MSRETFAFISHVNVFDAKRLKAAARKHARETGMGPGYRPNIREALQMVMDSGPANLSPFDMGFEIIESRVE